MNKQDEKQLKKHPRYKAIVEAHAERNRRVEAAQREIEAAHEAFEAAAPEVRMVDGRDMDERIFRALRPRGDKVRVLKLVFLGSVESEFDAEIENVTATQVTLVGHDKAFRDGVARHYDSLTYKIAEDDLARIKAGELKGWRQKPWGGQ